MKGVKAKCKILKENRQIAPINFFLFFFISPIAYRKAITDGYYPIWYFPQKETTTSSPLIKFFSDSI